MNQEGRYSCMARNKVGRAEADTFLQLIGKLLEKLNNFFYFWKKIYFTNVEINF